MIPFYGKNPSNSVFLSLRSAFVVKDGWNFDVNELSIPSNVHERISKIFPTGTLKPSKALWLNGDVGVVSDPLPTIVAPVSQGIMDLKYFMDTFM